MIQKKVKDKMAWDWQRIIRFVAGFFVVLCYALALFIVFLIVLVFVIKFDIKKLKRQKASDLKHGIDKTP